MKKDYLDYKFCITLTMDNSKKKIKLLEKGIKNVFWKNTKNVYKMELILNQSY